jgi:phenylalanyl-tRNA synthetase beta chain
MICSEDELGLVDERAQGIMKLEEYFDEALLAEKLGTPFFDLPLAIPGIAFGSAHYTTVGETVFEIDNKFITNRPDLFSVRGNAREMSVLFRLPFAGIPITFSDGAKAAHVSVLTKRAIAYHLLEFNNLDIKSSPLGIRLALRKS